MEINEKIEKFYADIVDTNGTFRITIPKSTIDGAGFKLGDRLSVWVKKVEKED